ncbi:MAG: BrnA antitoxin family protein [Desulfobacterales bacterium]
MRNEYDFSKGKRGPVIPPDPNKIRVTIRLDADIIDYFKGQVQKAGGGNYQTMINKALREYLNIQQVPLNEEILRRVIREELGTTQ